MAVQFEEKSGGKILEVKVTGKLTDADYQRFVPEFDRLVKEQGKIRVLFDMVDFHGWKAAALWDDVKLGFRHHADLERLAMVGDQTWEKWMSAFCRPFTSAEVRYFDRAQLEEARAWLSGG